jgi:membrane-bound serine protease (ClpP class)
VAAGGSVLLVHAASLAAIAPGAGLGPARPFDLGTSESRESSSDVQRTVAALFGPSARRGSLTADQRRLLDGPALPAGPAQQAGLVSVVAGDIPSLLDTLDGMTVQTYRGTVTLATQNRPDRPVAVRFHEIGPIWRVLHAVSTPIAVYVLLLIGLWAIAFELTQPALGVAGIAGAVALVFAGYGLSVIPVHWLGISLILAGAAFQGLDVLIRRVAWLTLLGTGLFATGSLLSWRGVASAIDLPLWLIALATVGSVLFLGFAMTVALRSRERIKTAQVGLVGLVGETRSDLNPEGGVLVKGAMWRARSLDGPIRKGARVRIRGVEGLILRVEQEPGQD